jgi:hypothetical protein
MKKLFAILAAVLVCAAATGQNAPEMKFDRTEHSFGKIAEKGGKVSHTYTFVNHGNAPLVILSVETSCGCTKAEYDKKPVPVGGKGEIVITYDPKRQSGVFYKAIQIFTNEPVKRRIIVAQGEVLTGK